MRTFIVRKHSDMCKHWCCRSLHRVQDLGEGLHAEERGRAFRSDYTQDRHNRTERTSDLEFDLPIARVRVRSLGRAGHLLGLDRLLLHQLPQRQRETLRGDRSRSREKSSRVRGTCRKYHRCYSSLLHFLLRFYFLN